MKGLNSLNQQIFYSFSYFTPRLLILSNFVGCLMHVVLTALLICVFSVNGAEKIKQPEKIEIEKFSLTQQGEIMITVTGGMKTIMDSEYIEQIVSKLSSGEILEKCKKVAKGGDEVAKVAVMILRIAEAYQKGARGDTLMNTVIKEIKSYGWDKLKGKALGTLAKKIGIAAAIKKIDEGVATVKLMFNGSRYIVYGIMVNLPEETMNYLDRSRFTELAYAIIEGGPQKAESIIGFATDKITGSPINPDDFKKNAEKDVKIKQSSKKSPKIKFIDINAPQWRNTVVALSLDKNDLQKQWAVTTEPFTFYDPYTEKNYTIPAGFIFDGASVPMKGVSGWVVGAITVGGGSWYPDVLTAGLIHDYLYRNPNNWTREQADIIFYKYLMARDFTASKSYYNGLRFLGGAAYQKHVDNYNAGRYAMFDDKYYQDNIYQIGMNDQMVVDGDFDYQSSYPYQLLLNGSGNGQTMVNGDVCQPFDDNNSSDDNVVDGDNITGNVIVSNNKSVVDGDLVCLPSDDNNYITEEENNENPDNSGNIVAGGSGIGKVVNAVLDNTAIVKPTISHKRILWLFSGESMWDSFKSAGKSLAENIKLSELRKNFSDMWGKVVGKNSSNMSDIESDIGSVKQYLDWTGE